MLANVLDQIQDKPHASPMPIEVLDFLHANKIPQDIIEDLKASSYSEWIQIAADTKIDRANRGNRAVHGKRLPRFGRGSKRRSSRSSSRYKEDGLHIARSAL